VKFQVNRTAGGWPVFRIFAAAAPGTDVISWTPAWNRGIEFRLPSTGRYTIVVGEWFSDETSSYELFLQQTRPPVTATAIRFGQSLTDATSYSAEFRFFQFQAAAGNKVSLQLTTVSGGQPCLQVFAATPAPAGTLLFDSNCGRQDTAIKRFDLTVSTAGTYIVRVTDALSDQTVRFTLFLECHGTCSAPPGGFPTTQITFSGCATCNPASVFAARVTAKNTLAEPAELKACFLVPDGTCIPIGNTHLEVPARLTFNSEVFRGPLPAGHQPGTWWMCARLLKSDCGDTIAAACRQITVVPAGTPATAAQDPATAADPVDPDDSR
jgi:hypothetical protein